MTEPQGPVVLIVDDHELIATTLEMALRSTGLNAERCRARLPCDIVDEAGRHPAGLTLLDLDLGWDPDGRRIDGELLVPVLVEQGWQVVVVSGTIDRVRLGGALAAGALACLPKRAPFHHLLVAVRRALLGQSAMDPVQRQAFVDLFHEQDQVRRDVAFKLARLSQREREVLAEIANGLRAQAVAKKYVVSLATVRTQIRGILTKLEVGSQLEAVALYRGARRG